MRFLTTFSMSIFLFLGIFKIEFWIVEIAITIIFFIAIISYYLFEIVNFFNAEKLKKLIIFFKKKILKK
jgi:hypothetical protein